MAKQVYEVKLNETITGLTNTTWNGTPVSGRAATEDQLAAATKTTIVEGKNIFVTENPENTYTIENAIDCFNSPNPGVSILKKTVNQSGLTNNSTYSFDFDVRTFAGIGTAMSNVDVEGNTYGSSHTTIRSPMLIAGDGISIAGTEVSNYGLGYIISAGEAVLKEDLTFNRSVGYITAGNSYPAGTPIEQILREMVEVQADNRRLWAAKASGTPGNDRSADGAIIDTGLTMNYDYEFIATGYTMSGFQTVLVGAFLDTTNRTTNRFLGSSKTVQCMWPENKNFNAPNRGIDITKMFTYTANAEHILIQQGDIGYYNYEFDDKRGDDNPNVKIYLFDEAATYQYNNGIIREVIIKRRSDGVILRQFQPWMIEGEVVMVDVANDNQVYRPLQGTLLEVSE